MQKRLKKPYFTNYDLLIAQDLWKAYYQILLIILLKEFIKLNENIDMNVKRVKLNTNTAQKMKFLFTISLTVSCGFGHIY